MTQIDLALRVNAKQPAISMYESGDDTALARKTLEKIAQILEIDLSSFDLSDAQPESAAEIALHFCPIDSCPSNIPFAVNKQLCFKPALVPAKRDSSACCSWCGELLLSTCPNEDCASEIMDGACCPDCGTAYITSTVKEAGWNAGKWADERRAKIKEIKEMGGGQAGALGA